MAIYRISLAIKVINCVADIKYGIEEPRAHYDENGYRRLFQLNSTSLFFPAKYYRPESAYTILYFSLGQHIDFVPHTTFHLLTNIVCVIPELHL